MSRRVLLLVAPIALIALALVGWRLASAKPLAPPSEHRATAEVCGPQRAAGHPEPGDSGTCHKDADCSAGKNGRCNPLGGGRMRPTNQCTYDACLADADCGGKSTCNCDSTRGNYCLPGNCRTDADCGAGGFCSASWPLCSLNGPFRPEGHYCHTPKDECTRDEDCPRMKEGGYGPKATRCNFAPENGHWVCTSRSCPVG